MNCYNKVVATETISGLRREMRTVLEDGAGIYRDEEGTQFACDKIAEIRKRYKGIEINDKSNVFNTDLQRALELRNLLDVAETIAEASLSAVNPAAPTSGWTTPSAMTKIS